MPPLESYESALAIAQDRANRMQSLMYIFHTTAGYYLTSMYEYPFVDRSNVSQIDEIWPQDTTNEIDWNHPL